MAESVQASLAINPVKHWLHLSNAIGLLRWGFWRAFKAVNELVHAEAEELRRTVYSVHELTRVLLVVGKLEPLENDYCTKIVTALT